jgi:hypothetical protein
VLNYLSGPSLSIINLRRKPSLHPVSQLILVINFQNPHDDIYVYDYYIKTDALVNAIHIPEKYL